jgi:hypothetical protein
MAARMPPVSRAPRYCWRAAISRSTVAHAM